MLRSLAGYGSDSRKRIKRIVRETDSVNLLRRIRMVGTTYE